jgi:hypothetical protein
MFGNFFVKIKREKLYFIPALQTALHIVNMALQAKDLTDVHKCNAWGYKWATLFVGDINTGTWSSSLGESQTRR